MIDEFLTLNPAAAKLRLTYYNRQRAARAGLFPTYRFHNRRILVRLSEVIASIEATRVGGVSV